jgi:hypothetical protein
MANNQYLVKLIGAAGESAQGVFVIVDALPHRQCRLVLQFAGGEITGEAFHYFEAMCQIREQLEPTGWLPVCYGASRNVYPSGMGRDMGRGLKAYRMHIGQEGTKSDLVRIFETGPDVEPVSVLVQRTFWKEWMKSIMDEATFKKLSENG